MSTNRMPPSRHVPATHAFHPLKKEHGGTVVIAKSTGEPLSNHPLPAKRALAQLRAVEFHKHNPGAA